MRVPELPFVGQKLQYSEAIFALLFLFALFQLIKGKLAFPERFPGIISLAAILAVFAVSLFNSHPGRKDLIEYAGIIYLAALYLLIVTLIRDQRDWYDCLTVWVWTSAGVCALGLFGYAMTIATGQPNWIVPVLNPPEKLALFPGALQFALRVCSTFRNPNMLAAYLIVSAAFLVLLIRKCVSEGNSAKNYVALLCLHVICALLTKSRIAFGVFLLATVALFILAPKRKLLALKIPAIAFTTAYGILSIVSVAIWVFPVKLNPIAINMKHTEYYLQSKAGFMMWKDHPLFGVGLGRYNQNLEKYFDWQEAAYSVPDPNNPAWRSKDPHSTYFGWLAESGLAGLLAIMIFLATQLKIAFRDKDAMIIGWGIAGFLIAAFSVDIVTMRHFWFLLGMNAAYASIKK